MKAIKIFSLIVVFVLVAMPAFSEPATRESIKKFMQSTGGGDLTDSMLNHMKPKLKNIAPDATEIFWSDIEPELDVNGVENKLISVYQKYFTENEIIAITSFFESAAGKKHKNFTEEDMIAIKQFRATPAGKKMWNSQPAMSQELKSIAKQWTQEITQKVKAKYEALSENQP